MSTYQKFLWLIVRLLEILHGGCFAAGTLVATAEGLRPIEQVRAGDQVLAADQYTGQRSFKPVVETFQTYPDALWEVSVQVAGKSRAEVLNTTHEHPFCVVQGTEATFTANSTPGEWVAAAQLQEGDRLRLSDDSIASVANIRRIAASNGSLTTYNLTVADHHTNFVGKAGVWVHNACNPTIHKALTTFNDFIRGRVPVLQKVNPLREQKNRFALLKGRDAARPYH